jgi:hypothetical protein
VAPDGLGHGTIGVRPVVSLQSFQRRHLLRVRSRPVEERIARLSGRAVLAPLRGRSVGGTVAKARPLQRDQHRHSLRTTRFLRAGPDRLRFGDGETQTGLFDGTGADAHPEGGVAVVGALDQVRKRTERLDPPRGVRQERLLRPVPVVGKRLEDTQLGLDEGRVVQRRVQLSQGTGVEGEYHDAVIPPSTVCCFA